MLSRRGNGFWEKIGNNRRVSWDIDAEVVYALTGKNLKEQLTDRIVLIEKINNNQIMHGLGELISAKEKSWVRNRMKADTIFVLKNYLSLLK